MNNQSAEQTEQKSDHDDDDDDDDVEDTGGGWAEPCAIFIKNFRLFRNYI